MKKQSTNDFIYLVMFKYCSFRSALINLDLLNRNSIALCFSVYYILLVRIYTGKIIDTNLQVQFSISAEFPEFFQIFIIKYIGNSAINIAYSKRIFRE